MNNTARTPLFIMGYPRSGTTLLRALLGAHSQIELVNEPEIIRGLRAAGWQITDRFDSQSLSSAIADLQKQRICCQHLESLGADVIAQLKQRPNVLSFKELYELLLPRSDNIPVWGEKSPGNVMYLHELRSMYPDAFFINIVRDPRAALLSHYRKRFAQGTNRLPTIDVKSIRFFAEGALSWRYWLEAAQRGRAVFGENVVHQLRFEELVTQPAVELERICKLLGLQFEPQMLDASRRKNDPVLARSRDAACAHQNLDQPVKPGRAGAREELPDWATYIVEKYAGRELKALGYPQSDRRLSVAGKLRINFKLAVAGRKIRSRVERDLARRQGKRSSTIYPP